MNYFTTPEAVSLIRVLAWLASGEVFLLGLQTVAIFMCAHSTSSLNTYRERKSGLSSVSFYNNTNPILKALPHDFIETCLLLKGPISKYQRFRGEGVTTRTWCIPDRSIPGRSIIQLYHCGKVTKAETKRATVWPTGWCEGCE